MNIPNLPALSEPLVDGKGMITQGWYRFFIQLLNEMQGNLSQEGLNVPSQTASKISTLQNKNPVPGFVVDSDNSALKFALNGVYKTVSLT